MSGFTSIGRFLPVVLICTAFGLGCGGGDGIADTVPVSGKVTVDGQPLTDGQVSFFPFDKETKTGAQCTGRIDPSGTYVMYTGGKSGVPPGRYIVTITPSMIPTGENKMPKVPFNSEFTESRKKKLLVNVSATPQPGEYDLKLTK